MRTFQFFTIVFRQFQLFLLAAVFLVSTGCVSYGRVDGPYEGKVIDAQTGQPIEGAVVSGVWNKAHPGVGGGRAIPITTAMRFSPIAMESSVSKVWGCSC